LHISIDIEAVGPLPHGRISQIGAVAFDLTLGASEQVEMLADGPKCLDVVIAPYSWGSVGHGEVAFWNSEEAAVAKAMLNAAPQVSIEYGLEQLSAFVRKYLSDGGSVWAKPPSYDCEMLRNAYRGAGMRCPWHFRSEACVRTAVRMGRMAKRGPLRVPDEASKGLVKHYAPHDAIAQALMLRAAWSAIYSRSPRSEQDPV